MLIGKTGQGKSSAGNALLNSKTPQFHVSHFSESETTKSKYASTARKKKATVVVVDTPGMFDTRNAKPEGIDANIRKELSRACLLLSPGLHAVILVIKAGERFTRETKNTIEIYQSMFGEDVWNYTFLLITHWDQMEEKRIRFDEYKENATADLKEVLGKCNGKCYPIGNRKARKQAKHVILKIEENVKIFGGGCFTNDLTENIENLLNEWIKRESSTAISEPSEETKVKTLLDEPSQELTQEACNPLRSAETKARSKKSRSDELRTNNPVNTEERRARLSRGGSAAERLVETVSKVLKRIFK